MGTKKEAWIIKTLEKELYTTVQSYEEGLLPGCFPRLGQDLQNRLRLSTRIPFPAVGTVSEGAW